MSFRETVRYSCRCGNASVSLVQTFASTGPLCDVADLHICHLGMKFLSPEPLPEFGMYEFDIRVGAGRGPVRCTGVVVKSDPEGDGFRTVIHFVGLGGEDRRLIEQATRSAGMRCNDCGNC